MTRTIVLIAIVASIIGGGIYTLIIGVKKTEKNECDIWKAQEGIFKNFTSPQWAKEQCKTFNITLTK